VLDGDLHFVTPTGFRFLLPLNSMGNDLNGGSWTISESAPGSGDWTLSLDGQHFTHNYSLAGEEGTWGFGGTIVATAQFSAANIDTLGEADTQAEALGGAAATGGVSAEFSQPTGGGTFAAQQLPSQFALSQDALAAAAIDPIYTLSTATLSAAPQIWNVDFSGDLNGASATLVFNYNPALLPLGLDPQSLGIWHFNSNTNQWEFGGQVDADDHTISFQTNSFSPFQLGVVVPEPSSVVLAALGLLLLATARMWRRKAR
jgi:hypothetical protein